MDHMKVEYPVIKGFYRHSKSGRSYQVLAIGHDSETLEKVVVYQGLYTDPEFGNGPVWIRPVSEFLGTVLIEGEEYVRFVFEGVGGYDPGDFDD